MNTIKHRKTQPQPELEPVEQTIIFGGSNDDAIPIEPEVIISAEETNEGEQYGS